MTSPTSFIREVGQRSLPRAHSPEVAPLSSLRVASADLSVPRASFRPLLVVVVVRSPGASDVASSRLHRHSRVVDADAGGLHTLPRPSLEFRGRSGLDRHRQASQSPFSSVIGDGIAPLMPRPPGAPRSSSVCDSRHSPCAPSLSPPSARLSSDLRFGDGLLSSCVSL